MNLRRPDTASRVFALTAGPAPQDAPAVEDTIELTSSVFSRRRRIPLRHTEELKGEFIQKPRYGG